VSRTSLFATSLIGALPGAVLAYLCVMAFLNYAGGGSILLKVLTGLLLVVGLAMPALSVAALMSGRAPGAAKPAKKEKKEKKEKKGNKSKAAAAEEEFEDAVDGSDDDVAVTAEIANTGEVEEFSLDDDGLGDDLIVEDDDEPKSKKKKKK